MSIFDEASGSHTASRDERHNWLREGESAWRRTQEALDRLAPEACEAFSRAGVRKNKVGGPFHPDGWTVVFRYAPRDIDDRGELASGFCIGFFPDGNWELLGLKSNQNEATWSFKVLDKRSPVQERNRHNAGVHLDTKPSWTTVGILDEAQLRAQLVSALKSRLQDKESKHDRNDGRRPLYAIWQP